jgi:tetratricopeptide (TPR) repeat protein
MEYIIGWSLFIIGLIGALIIVGRKFSLLANIDVAEIQTEKNAQLKQQIIASQLRRRFGHAGLFFARLVKPFSKLLRNTFDWLYDKVNNWQRAQANREAMIGLEISKRIDVLLFEAEEMVRDGRLEGAEKKYIEIIGLDPKNFRAFKDLGEVYLKNQNLNEARQTLEHALRLKKNSERAHEGEEKTKTKEVKDLELSQAYFLLGTIFEEAGEYAKAIVQLKRGLKIERHNPRYLDRMIEVSILKKDKINAQQALTELETVNPENQKLANFKERIEAL